MPTKSRDAITPAEIAEFRNAMQGVKPLVTEREAIVKNTSKAIAVRKSPFSKNLKLNPLSDPSSTPVQANDYLFFSRPGLQRKVTQDLRKGRYPQTALLDLHGMTVEQARSAIKRFITHSQQAQQRCVRVIHGKGQTKTDAPPILKNHIHHWLPQLTEVLAFCSAQPRDGGMGAVYILLKMQY